MSVAGAFVRAALLGLALVPTLAAAFDWEDVDRKAAALAGKPYENPRIDLPAALKNLDYDQYRDIRFRPDRALWRAEKLPFEVAFFHRGGQFREPVRMNELLGGEPRALKFRAADFDYGKNALDRNKIGSDLDYAGLRVHFHLNNPKYKDEVLVLLGASYFRALGKDQVYGLSARGLAIDTALPSGEEFPRFVEFWLERPLANAKELRILALLDSKSMTGAYQFILRPGVDTVLDVKARLHSRRNVAKLGVAPLTSMYLFGENQRAATEDYRPEVHDSDGLMVHAGTNEWIWRPLVNPRRLLVTSFAANNAQGFGLMQRDRNFAAYEDLEARYELRPSAWVKPLKPFGPGRVELVQIPSPAEYNDNIVAYWVPRDPPQAGKTYEMEYQVLWQKNTPMRPPHSWVAQTRRGPGFVRAGEPATTDFHIDFVGPALKKATDEKLPEAVFSVDSSAEIVEKRVQRNPVAEGVRVSLKLKRNDPAKPVELRGFLRDEAETLSETWAYILPPE